MPSTIPCPKCGEFSFHKSHTKNKYEKTRKEILKQRPYRCHTCGYRSWISKNILKPKQNIKQTILYLAVFIIATLVSYFLKNYLF